MISNKTKLLLFFLLSSLTGALLVYFLVSTFALRVFYFVSFFLFSFFLQIYVFSDFSFDIEFKGTLPQLSVLWKILTSIYTWGIIASVIILFVPNDPFPIYTESVYRSFLSLSSTFLLKIVSGYFIVSFFSGKVVYDSFLKKHNFDRVEQIGFALAFSLIFSTLLGLVIERIFGFITPLLFLASLWISILPMTVYRYAKEKRLKSDVKVNVNSVNHYAFNYGKWGIMLSLGAILLFSAYFVHMFSHPLSGIYSGDLLFYIRTANEYMNFGSTQSPYLWFQIYLKITSCVTGLPLLYSLAGLQFLIVLVPVAFYILIRTLFPHLRKAPTLTAAFILIQGLSAFPVAIILMIKPILYSQYMNGNVMSVLGPYMAGVGSGVSGWLSVFVSIIEIVMGALAFSFAYRYFKENHYVDLLISSIFMVSTIFFHGIFFIPLFFLTLILFLLLQKTENASKKLLLFIALESLLLVVFDFFDNFHFLLNGNNTSSYFLSHFWPILPFVTLIIYAKEKIIKNRFKLHFFDKSKTIKGNIINIPKTYVTFFIYLFLFSIMAFSIYLGVLTWGQPLYTMRNPFFPWFVYTLCFGLSFTLAIYGLRLLIRLTERKGLTLISCWILALIILGLTGPYLLAAIFPLLSDAANIFNRFIMQITYLLCCLSALFLGSLDFSKISGSFANNSLSLNFFAKSKSSLTKIVPLLLTLIVAISFLFIPYQTEYYYAAGRVSGVTSPLVDSVNWINVNIQDNNIILPLSDSSYTQLSALTRLKVFPPNRLPPLDLASSTQLINKKIITDYQQNSFWNIQNIGSGSYQAKITVDSSEIFNGTNSVKIDVSSGQSSVWSMNHVFSPVVDWSDKDVVCIDFYGSNTGVSFTFQIWTPDVNNRAYSSFADNFGGWEELVFPINEFTTVGEFNLTNVAAISISPESVSNVVSGAWYLNSVVTADNFTTNVASVQTYLNNYFRSLGIDYVYSPTISSLNLQTQEPALFSLAMSAFPRVYEEDNITIYNITSPTG